MLRFSKKDGYWANKRIVITGSEGFIGLHLTRFFITQGAKVIGLSNHKKAKKPHILSDVTDWDSLHSVFLHNKPELCIHLAAHALVEEGEKSPYTTFQNNIIGSLNILELCRIHAVSRIIIASTAHVYGDAPPPCEETEPPRPSRPYETSKTCVDLIAQSYADTYQLPVIIPRFSNIYGPGDMNMTRIIPKTIHAILHGLSPTYWNDGIKREYLYIDDAIRAYDMMGKGNLDIMSDNRILNFGTGNPVNAKKIIQMIIQHMNDSIIPKEISSPRKHEIPFQQVSWEKAKHLLGWKPLVTLEEGLSRTIRWYRSRH